VINPPPFAQAMFTRPGVLSREWWKWLNKIHQTAQLVEDALPLSQQDAAAEAEAYAEYAMLAGIQVNSEPDDPQDALGLSYMAAETTNDEMQSYVPPFEPTDSDDVPIGTIVAFRFTDIPEKWLVLNGATINRVSYPELSLLYGGGGATFTLDNFQDLPLWGDGEETLGTIVGFDQRSCKADLSGANTSWTGTGESVLTIADATASVTAGTGAASATGTHSHTISGGDHDHTIKTFEYQTAPEGGETVTDDAFTVLPKRAIVKWIIKARN